MIEKFSYETLTQERTYNTFESIACWNNASVHDYVKFLKYGYGKVTDHASRDIRLKRITRAEGARLVEQYQSVVPENLQLLLEWIGMSQEDFLATVDKFRDPQIWLQKDGDWMLRDSVMEHIDDAGSEEVQLESTNANEYALTDLKEVEEREEGYILLGRAYMDEVNYKAVEG
jgi:hypothetical protein